MKATKRGWAKTPDKRLLWLYLGGFAIACALGSLIGGAAWHYAKEHERQTWDSITGEWEELR